MWREKSGIKRITLIFAALMVLTVSACFVAFKLADHVVVQDNVNSSEVLMESGELDIYKILSQTFKPQHEHLYSVGVKISKALPDAQSDGLYLRIMDSSYREVAAASTLITMMPEKNYYHFIVDIKVDPQETYELVFQYAGAFQSYPRFVAYELEKEFVEENGYYTYDGEIVGNYALDTEYRYITQWGNGVAIALCAVALLGAGLVTFLILKFVKKEWLNKTVYPGKWAKEHQGLCMYSFCALMGVVYCTLIWNHNIWTDEAFTVDLLKNCKTPLQVWEFTAGDVHPPLYYLILLPFSNLFGIKLWMLKFLSIVPMVGTLIIGPAYLKNRFGNKTAWLYMVILTAMPITMEYAVQVRMYSWAMLFLTLCFIMAFRSYETGRVRYFVYTGIFGVACAYTHYFTFVAAIWVYGFLFLALLFTKEKRKELIKWLGMAIGSLVLYLPWLPCMLRQVSGVSKSYWISDITPQVVRGYLDWFFETDLAYAPVMIQVVCIVALVLGIYVWFKEKELRQEVIAVFLGLVVLLGTVSVGVVMSTLIRPVFIIRYAIPCMGLLSVFLAYTLSKLPDRVYGILIWFWIAVGAVEYTDTHYVEYDSTKAHEMIAFFDANLGENDYVMYNYKSFDFIYQYYFDKDKLVYLEGFDWSQEFDDMWFLRTAFQPDITGEQLENFGLTKTFMGNYSIEHNSFSVYQIRKK